ncbi:MAG: hypothetical protein ABS79_05285 [Planctomycetes bacterium SCN 63-9]|nr:MAG: hypothetical protein ABS79_05285 [Planctomycetes bacterium SCN 63-9]
MILLLTRPEIQQELQLTPKLISEAKTLGSELQRRATALHGQSGPGVLTARRVIDEHQTQWLSEHLSPTQLERLQQLDLQWEGPTACVSRPIIADYLRLSAEQRASITQLIANRESIRKQQGRPAETEEAFARSILHKLSRPQQEQWNELQGRPIRFLADPQPQGPGTAESNAKMQR